MDALNGFRQADNCPARLQHVHLDQRADALLEEERSAFGARNQEIFKRLKRAIVAEQGAEHFHGALGRQRVEAKLANSKFCSPSHAGTQDDN